MSPMWPGHRPGPRARLAALALRALGWTAVLEPPPGPRLVVVAAPHTSNADFWPGILWKYATGAPARFVAKRELFAFPLGPLLRALGGIAVDRRRAGGNFVQGVVQTIGEQGEVLLVVAPEGTRARAEGWRTGFYHMAVGAGVPVGVMALDWGRRRVGLVGYVQPTGDLDADFAAIGALLRGVQGRRPELMGPVRPGGPTSPRVPAGPESPR